MTAIRKRLDNAHGKLNALASHVLSNGSGFELRRVRGRAVLALEGVLSVRHLTDECISLATHSGMLTVKGRGLALLIFEGRAVKVYGIVESVERGYGRT